MIVKIEIDFPLPVELPKGWEEKLSNLVSEVCDKYKQEHPDRVMWPAGHGYKPTYIPLTMEDEKHRGMEFDDSIFHISVSEHRNYNYKGEKKNEETK